MTKPLMSSGIDPVNMVAQTEQLGESNSDLGIKFNRQFVHGNQSQLRGSMNVRSEISRSKLLLQRAKASVAGSRYEE